MATRKPGEKVSRHSDAPSHDLLFGFTAKPSPSHFCDSPSQSTTFCSTDLGMSSSPVSQDAYSYSGRLESLTIHVRGDLTNVDLGANTALWSNDYRPRMEDSVQGCEAPMRIGVQGPGGSFIMPTPVKKPNHNIGKNNDFEPEQPLSETQNTSQSMFEDAEEDVRSSSSSTPRDDGQEPEDVRQVSQDRLSETDSDDHELGRLIILDSRTTFGERLAHMRAWGRKHAGRDPDRSLLRLYSTSSDFARPEVQSLNVIPKHSPKRATIPQSLSEFGWRGSEDHHHTTQANERHAAFSPGLRASTVGLVGSPRPSRRTFSHSAPRQPGKSKSWAFPWRRQNHGTAMSSSQSFPLNSISEGQGCDSPRSRVGANAPHSTRRRLLRLFHRASEH